MTDRLEVEFDADGKVDVDALRARIDRRVMDGRAADAEAEVADLVRKADDALAAALASEQAAVDFLKGRRGGQQAGAGNPRRGRSRGVGG